MFEVISIALYILSNVVILNGQYVQTMLMQETCVPVTVTLRCSNNYVAVVRSALHGVAQVAGSCSYQPGDCIVDSMSSVACLTDSIQCSIYATRKKLPQCNDQYSSYFRVVYDCVPISMDDSLKEYHVCQNGTEITTDHGILRSPGYPSQFQLTPVECVRTIHIPQNKSLRLWLTDLAIDSTSTNCANDYVYVVDNVQTYKQCGTKRYAYPYLCSSAVVIQYFVQHDFDSYRGMRMYFEIIDRPAHDSCPAVTVTPVPSITTPISTFEPGTTTNTPVYVLLGIASPIRSFQICPSEFYTIKCPNDYRIAVTTNLFGVTPSDQCEPHDANRHCVVTTGPTFLCRQTCVYMYPGNEILSSCNNKTAAYQYVEYQCVPAKTALVSSNVPCSDSESKYSIQIDRNGRFQSYNYPQLTHMTCTYRLKAKPGHIMHIYALDISLNNYNPNCRSNTVTFVEDDDTQVVSFCEERSSSLIYSSCSNELDLRYVVTDDLQPFSYGIELYIESQARPFDWTCGGASSTSTQSTTTRTTPARPNATSITSLSLMTALDPVEYDICFNETLVGICPYGFTFLIVNAYYGVKKQISNKCGFVQDDCLQEATSTVTQCHTDSPNCYLSYLNKRRLAHCSDNYADYLHITYQCVPSFPTSPTSSLIIYGICNTTDRITDTNGILISPNFPNYQQTNKECKREIVGIHDRALKIWINEMAIASDNQRDTGHSDAPDLTLHKTSNLGLDYYSTIRDACIDNYLIIDTAHIVYVYCGIRKLVLEPLCTTSVIIQYKTSALSNLSYKGFKLYFEWIEKPMDIFCQGTPSTYNPSLSTTTSVSESLPTWAQNLDVSYPLNKHVCLGTMETLQCPRGNDYALAIRNSNYGVTGTGLCEFPSFSHCRQEASLGLTCQHTCSVEYLIPKPLSQCNNQNGDYLKIEYECIPTRLPNHESPLDICASIPTETVAIDKGMMVSPQYPALSSGHSCSKRIETLPSKLWMVYLVDLFLESEDDFGGCMDTSLTIYDGKDKIVLCGLQQPGLVLFSCSNIVQFDFISSHQALGYRGFKVYFKTIDIPIGWSCVPSGFSTTTKRTTTSSLFPLTTLIPPSFQIVAYGGLTTPGVRQYCHFPFIYQDVQHTSCVSSIPPFPTPEQTVYDPWCSVTGNLDTDEKWGFCDIGVTDSTFYDLCRGQLRSLKCPSGYVIDIITADYAAKTDEATDANACFYDENDCFQSGSSIIENACAGRTSCTAYHYSKTLAACQNRPSAYLHLGYTCVPNTVENITTYDICNNQIKPTGDIRRGYLTSPNFPNSKTNINCTYDLHILKPHRDIYLYIIDMDLNMPNLVEQNCNKDRLIVNADGSVTEWCGRSPTNLLLRTCHASLSLQLIRSTDAKGRGIKLYFEFRQRAPTEICEEVITPSPRPTLSPPLPTVPSRPNYFPDPSPRMIKTLCYPDVSALLGANNVQCPSDYIIVIHRAFYGKGNQCAYTPGDCTSEAGNVHRLCSGNQACSVSFLSIFNLAECDEAIANYLSIQYQCLPTATIVPTIADACSNPNDQLTPISGLLQSTSYPNYTQTQCANTTLSAPEGSNLVIYIYLIDLDIDVPDTQTGQCNNDYLLMSYQCNNDWYNIRLCGTHYTEVLFDTCSPTDAILISYNLTSSKPQSRRGFSFLYHLLPASIRTTPLITSKASTSITTTEMIIGPGPVSTAISQSTACVQQNMQLKCNPNYGLVLHKIDLAVSRTGSCNYSTDDCFEERTYLHGTCGGQSSCFIFVPLLSLTKCNNSKSNYFYAEYQCIPLKPKLMVDICLSTTELQSVKGGAIIQTKGYTSENRRCHVQLQSEKSLANPSHKAFAVYVLMLDLPFRAFREQGTQCYDNDPYIEIIDTQIGTTRLCGNMHTRQLFDTCSDTIEIRYNNFNIGLADRYKGFQLYVESIEKKECSQFVTTTPVKQREPFVIHQETVCETASQISFSCTVNHGLVFLQSYEYVTSDPQACNISQQTCHYLSEQPQALCSGQQICSYVHTIPIGPHLNTCQGIKGDLLQFSYQCIPMRPTEVYPKATFCDDQIITFSRGFIDTPKYPNTYGNGQQQCSLRIVPANASESEQLSIFLYIINLSIRDSSTTNSTSSAIECYDSITYRDGQTSETLCGLIDQPVLKHQTNQNYLELTLNITESHSNISSQWYGARLFFFVANHSRPFETTTFVSTAFTSTQTVTTKPIVDMTTKPTLKGPKYGPMIAGIVTGLVVLLIVAALAFVYYRRRSFKPPIETPLVEYRKKPNLTDENTTDESSEKRCSSIPTSSLRAKTYHEQIQIKDGSIGNSYEKIFSRFLNDSVTQITVQDPYIRAYHQISNFVRFCEAAIKSSANVKQIELITK
ncbi:unnamed protein product [Adineta ricciae]|uniref:Uncharacterized protein n=1 Tax=Adineta ricciae TaxID=249248 RepID=A0A813RTZ7_ADIRI|nr:unnamed protein product [Adineta ricciae]